MRREEKVFNLCFFGEISGVINLRIKDFEFEAFLGLFRGGFFGHYDGRISVSILLRILSSY